MQAPFLLTLEVATQGSAPEAAPLTASLGSLGSLTGSGLSSSALAKLQWSLSEQQITDIMMRGGSAGSWTAAAAGVCPLLGQHVA